MSFSKVLIIALLTLFSMSYSKSATINLKDGTTYKGKIVEQVSGRYILFEKITGEKVIIREDEIRSINIETVPSVEKNNSDWTTSQKDQPPADHKQPNDTPPTYSSQPNSQIASKFLINKQDFLNYGYDEEDFYIAKKKYLTLEKYHKYRNYRKKTRGARALIIGGITTTIIGVGGLTAGGLMSLLGTYEIYDHTTGTYTKTDLIEKKVIPALIAGGVVTVAGIGLTIGGGIMKKRVKRVHNYYENPVTWNLRFQYDTKNQILFTANF